MQIYFQVEYIILTEDAFRCSKEKPCCRWLSISKIYGRLFITKESQHDDDDDDDDDNDDNDGIEKEDILLLEDNVKEELQELKKEMTKMLHILETLQQKVLPSAESVTVVHTV